MASKGIVNAIGSLAYERDRQEFALGDTLDIKTGLILAALTFLAIQSGTLIHAGLVYYLKIVQYISVFALIAGGVFVVMELYPREYEREANPLQYQKWVDEMENYKTQYPEAESLTEENFTAARIASAIQSIQTNHAINRRKTTFMLIAFVCTMVSFSMNILTLINHLF